MNEVLPLALFAGLLLIGAVSDVATMKIPNWVSIALAAGYVLFAAIAQPGWAPFGWHLLFGFGVLIAGFLLFQIGIVGGGDVKLIAAASLWTGLGAFGAFALWMAIAGGLLALILLIARKIVQPSETRPAFINRLLKPRGGVPYGVAIAAGGIAAASAALTLP